MGISMEAANALESAIDGKIAKAAAKSTRANGTVTRIDKDGTPYVRLDGSDTDTPAARAAAAVRVGEHVGVTVSGGSMAIDGNWSAPATDDTAANAAQSTADAAIRDAGVAASAAAAAVQSAEVAEQAAQDAQDSLRSVVQGATTVEKAVSVMQTALEAIVDYDPDTDTTTEYFWHDANGAHVLGDTSGYRNDIDSTGMDIKQVDTERSVAHFGADGAQIGKTGDSNLQMDSRGMTLVDMDDDAYFDVGDLRESDGSIVERFIGDGQTSSFFLSAEADSPSASTTAVTVDGVAQTWGFGSERPYTVSTHTASALGNYSLLDFPDNAPADGAVIVVEYIPSGDTKFLTFGTRTQQGPVGGSSAVFGKDCEARAEHAFAQGKGTVASLPAQSVFGRYNEKDLNDEYAFIIGNGTADNARKNAAAVGWDGIPYHRNPSDTWGSVFDLIYPIGSIYMSVNSVNPQVLFGGTWQQISDTFLLAAGSTYAAGTTGGEAEHTLTAAESGVPAHGHGFTDPTYKTSGSDGTHSHTLTMKIAQDVASGSAKYCPRNNASGTSTSMGTVTGGGHGHTITKKTSGSVSNNTAANASSAHNNMPPYLAVYVWKRTA